jgi:hypothetical protein
LVAEPDGHFLFSAIQFVLNNYLDVPDSHNSQ